MGGSFSATNHVLPIPEGGWPWGVLFQLQTMYSRFPRGVGHGGCFFSYKPCTPDSRGGLAMGGSFSATNHVLPIPAEKARPTGLDFWGVAPEWVYRFSRRRRGRLAGPGNDGPGPAGQAVFRPPEGPFWCSRGRFFRQSQKERERETRAGFFGSKGGWPWGGRFQLRTTYSRFRRRKSLSNSNFTRGPGSNVCTDFPGLHFGGVRPPWLLSKLGMD